MTRLRIVIIFKCLNFGQKRSLGCVLYEIATLTKAFDDKTDIEVRNKILTQYIPTVNESHVLNKLIKRFHL